MSVEDNRITIWGAGTSRTFRPIWTAEEIGLSYKHLPIGPRTGETTTAEYTNLNRKQKVPFMHDGTIGLSESVAICRYLIGKYGRDGSLYIPNDAESQAKEDEWICYIYGELDETALYVMRRHGDLKDIYGEAPEAVASARAYAVRHLKVVEEHLQDASHVMGDQFGLADILLTSCLDWAEFYGIELFGSLIAYRAEVAERPASQRAFTTNFRQMLAAASGGQQ